jgi:hypothetical protein
MSDHGAAVPTGAEDRAVFLQRGVDAAANFHLYSRPDGAAEHAYPFPACAIDVAQPIFPFAIEQQIPEPGAAMRAVNRVGRRCGTLSFRCIPVSWSDRLLPDQEPRAIPLDPESSQRVAIRDFTIRFDAGHSLFLFGAGRLFPTVEGNKTKLLIAAVCDIRDGCGSFTGLKGNITFCGELQQEGFRGHVMVRLPDPGSVLLTEEPVGSFETGEEIDEDAAYLTWIGQKMPGPEFANFASVTSDGSLRGLNIPVALRHIATGFSLASGKVLVQRIAVGNVLGKEIGFGRESVPRTSISGTPVTPFQFEGVSLYRMFDDRRDETGSFVSNVIEGRSFSFSYARAPLEPGLRFGFFGPSITGTGCFSGVSAMLYGCSGSVFNLPPGIHVISNWYVLRISDPDRRFRARGTGVQ